MSSLHWNLQWKKSCLWLEIYKIISKKDILSTSEIDVKWMPQDHTNKKWTLAQVMACCRQASMLTQFYIAIFYKKKFMGALLVNGRCSNLNFFFFIQHADGYIPNCSVTNLTVPIDHKSTLAQVMSRGCQVSSLYPIQWWPTSLSPYGVIRPRWIKQRSIVLWDDRIPTMNI